MEIENVWWNLNDTNEVEAELGKGKSPSGSGVIPINEANSAPIVPTENIPKKSRALPMHRGGSEKERNP